MFSNDSNQIYAGGLIAGENSRKPFNRKKLQPPSFTTHETIYLIGRNREVVLVYYSKTTTIIIITENQQRFTRK